MSEVTSPLKESTPVSINQPKDENASDKTKLKDSLQNSFRKYKSWKIKEVNKTTTDYGKPDSKINGVLDWVLK